MASLNNEGFALGPSCAEGTMTAIWADDGASAGHVLREATLGCTAIAVTGTVPVRSRRARCRRARSRRSTDPHAKTVRSAVLVGLAVALAIAAAATVLVRRTRVRR
jgi:hypothetical protein